MKRSIFSLGLAALILLLAACGTSSTPSTSNTTNAGAGAAKSSQTMMMGATTFQTTAVAVTKGGTITFTDDPSTGTPHILVVGKDGAASAEAGAPDFGGASGKSFEPGQSWTTSAWMTPGTYYVTCIVHPTSMTLTITVAG